VDLDEHGFFSRTSDADVARVAGLHPSHRIDRRDNPSKDLTIAWDHPKMAIRWPLEPSLGLAADHAARRLAELCDRPADVRAMP
jgi:hypothetical protein